MIDISFNNYREVLIRSPRFREAIIFKLVEKYSRIDLYKHEHEKMMVNLISITRQIVLETVSSTKQTLLSIRTDRVSSAKIRLLLLRRRTGK